MTRLFLLFTVLAATLCAPAAPRAPRVRVQQRLFTAISRMENCAAWRNPGCLKYARQAGAVRGPHGYARFRTKALGARALRLQIARGRGQTVLAFLRRYNPQYPDYPARVAALARLQFADVL